MGTTCPQGEEGVNKGYFHVIAGLLTLFICVLVQAETSYNYTSFDVDIAGANNTRAYGIDGSNIVGWYKDASGYAHGFKYDGSSYTALDVTSLGADDTYAYGIDGSNIAGLYYDGSSISHGFSYDGSSYTAIDETSLGATKSYAHGIDGDKRDLSLVRRAADLIV